LHVLDIVFIPYKSKFDSIGNPLYGIRMEQVKLD